MGFLLAGFIHLFISCGLIVLVFVEDGHVEELGGDVEILNVYMRTKA